MSTPMPGDPLAVTESRVGVADSRLLRGSGILSTHGLGSCIALAIYDAETRCAVLAHILLPCEDRAGPVARPARSAVHAVPLLLRKLRSAGAGRRLVAKMAGGASMFGPLLLMGGVNMGERNIKATRRALQDAGVLLVAEDVGGDYGRSVYFDVSTGTMLVRSLKRGDRTL
ncbi:MAG: Chemoreceptor glutamine deamidase CheD [Gemmatimonadaceae bacterium]|nr:Chemoreceptor glutamine deamidase CheD [Gemmatimonadaceae bacterium]